MNTRKMHKPIPRSFLNILFAALLLIIVVSCGSDENTEPVKDTFIEIEEEEISIDNSEGPDGACGQCTEGAGWGPSDESENGDEAVNIEEEY